MFFMVEKRGRSSYIVLGILAIGLLLSFSTVSVSAFSISTGHFSNFFDMMVSPFIGFNIAPFLIPGYIFYGGGYSNDNNIFHMYNNVNDALTGSSPVSPPLCLDEGSTFVNCSGLTCTGTPTQQSCLVGGQYASSPCSAFENADGACTTNGEDMGCNTIDTTDPSSNTGTHTYVCAGTASCSPSQCDQAAGTAIQTCEYNISTSCSGFLPDASCTNAGCTISSCSSITNENTCISTPGCTNICEGSPQKCSSESTRTFTCSGEYQLVNVVASSTFGACSPGIASNGDKCILTYTNQRDCEGDPGCTWSPGVFSEVKNISCSTLSENNCYSTPGCSPQINCANSCPTGETAVFSSCSGTYQKLEPSSTFGACSPGIASNGDKCILTYTNQRDCEGDPGCTWRGAYDNVSYSCSGLTQTQCAATSGCTEVTTCSSPTGSTTCSDSDSGLNYTSYGIVTVTNTTDNTQKTWGDLCKTTSTLFEYYCNGNLQAGIDYTCPTGSYCSSGACVPGTPPTPSCQICSTDADCSNGDLCMPEQGSTNSVCVPSGSCALYNSSDPSSCLVSDGTTDCSVDNSQVLTCNGTARDWNMQTNCSAINPPQTCDSTTAPPQCINQNPVLFWADKYGDSLNPPNTLSGNPGDPSTTAQLLVLYAQGQTGTFYLNESGLTSNHFILTIPNPVYNSASNSLSYNWSITNDSLTPVGSDHLTNPDQYNFYYTYNGYNSPMLNYTNNAKTLYCGDNICSPSIGENITSCPDDCSALEWTNASSPYNSISALTVNYSDIAMSALGLRGFLQGQGLTSKFNFTDYPAKAGANMFIANQDGVNYDGNLASTISVDVTRLREWRLSGGLKSSVVKTNADGSMNEEYKLEVSAAGYKTNMTLNIDNTPNCIIYDNCSTDIHYCSDYNDSDSCNGDTSFVDTSKPNYICSWNDTQNKCVEIRLDVAANGAKIGTCTYSQQTETGTCNSTGFLTYSWDASWAWNPENNYTIVQALNKDGTLKDGFVKISGTNYFRYDPNNAATKCGSGKTIAACPAKVELSFFNLKNLLAAAILIALIYFIIYSGKAKKKSLPKKTTKKVVKKKSSKKRK